jgi:small subunit ribosomal protein S16
MLAIRMQRTGRKGHAMFRVVVQDSRRTPTSGKVVARLGSYDPHGKVIVLDKEKASFYLDHGAQPSERVTRLLKNEGVKLPDWVTLSADKERTVRNADKRRSTRPPEEKPAEEPVAEAAAAEETAKAPAEPEAASDEPAAETPTEEPAETETPETTEEASEEAPAAEESAESTESAAPEAPAEVEPTAATEKSLEAETTEPSDDE